MKLCNLLKEFNAISHLEMAKLKKLKNTVFNLIATSLQTNSSLVYLNYEQNAIDLPGFNYIFDYFEKNHIVIKIKVTIPQ